MRGIQCQESPAPTRLSSINAQEKGGGNECHKVVNNLSYWLGSGMGLRGPRPDPEVLALIVSCPLRLVGDFWSNLNIILSKASQASLASFDLKRKAWHCNVFKLPPPHQLQSVEKDS